MTTWADIIGLVLRDSGVAAQGQTPSAQMANDTKTRLNFLLNQWKRRRWLVYHLIDVSAPCDGSLFYTLGPGQTFDTPRTDQIQAAYARQVTTPTPNQVDYPLALIHSYEDYSSITLKNMQAGPAYWLFYDSGYPTGKVYPWPLMSSTYELHLIVKAELATVVNLTDTVVLPEEYHMAIYYCLIQMTRIAFQLPADPEVNRMASAALETLRMANFQPPTTILPAVVGPLTRGGYNIWSDGYGPRR